MKKILFTHSYFLQFDPKQKEINQPYPPLGTLYAASLMRNHGYSVSLADTMFAQSAQEIEVFLQSIQPDFLVIYDDGFNYLTKMCLTNMRDAAFEMIRLAKEYNCTVIVSSSDATDHFENYLKAGADFVLLGEAEYTLLELTEAINNHQNFFDISGIVFMNKEAIVKTKKREVIKELDGLPMPAWDLLDISFYKKAWQKSSGYFSINLATTRGCPFKCNWCAKPIYGNRYNVRSPQNVVNEIIYLKRKFKFDHIWFCDDIFGLQPGWVEEFATLVKNNNLSFHFKIQSRADLLLQPNYTMHLAAAGCNNAWMGAESGSQKILDAMNKGITISQIESAVKLLKEFKINPSLFIQFGYLGETKEDIQLTINMIKKLMPHEIGISISYPLPGTVYYEKVKTTMQQKTNWTDSDEMAMMFQNTFSPEFYKSLPEFVHSYYKYHLSIQHIRSLLKNPFSTKPAYLKKAATFFYYWLLMMRYKPKLSTF